LFLSLNIVEFQLTFINLEFWGVAKISDLGSQPQLSNLTIIFKVSFVNHKNIGLQILNQLDSYHHIQQDYKSSICGVRKKKQGLFLTLLFCSVEPSPELSAESSEPVIFIGMY